MLMEPSWAVLEFELASALHGVLKNYWHSQQVRRKTMFRPRSQVWLACCMRTSDKLQKGDQMIKNSCYVSAGV